MVHKQETSSLLSVSGRKYFFSAFSLLSIFIVFLSQGIMAEGLREVMQTATGLDNSGKIQWIKLEKGLEFCDVKPPDGESKISILKIDPEDFTFVLGSSGKTDSKSRTLAEWVEQENLIAAINASMYLPDGKTSTGFMKEGDYINNPKIVERFGAFFVANPKKDDLPGAMIIDREQPDWKSQLENFDLVIQNYRMTNEHRKILWSPGGPLYSISALGQTRDGKILFIHSVKPVEAYSFIQQLLHLDLDIGTIMYVEGGAQAGLVINSENLQRSLVTPHARSLLITGKINAVLPNIIGIKRKSAIN